MSECDILLRSLWVKSLCPHVSVLINQVANSEIRNWSFVQLQ